MARKNLEVQIAGGSTALVPEVPKVEVPVAPEPVVEEKTKPSRRGKRNG